MERMGTRRGGVREEKESFRAEPKPVKADAHAEEKQKPEKASAPPASAPSSGAPSAAGGGGHGGTGAPRAKKPKIEHEDTSWGGAPPPAPIDLVPQPLLNIHDVAGQVGEAGFVDGPCESALFSGPSGIAVGPDGSLLVMDSDNRRLRKIVPCSDRSPSGLPDGGAGSAAGDGAESRSRVASQEPPVRFQSVATVAGTGHWGTKQGRGASATVCDPYGVVVDASGNIFFTDAGSHTVRRVGTGGEVSLVAGSGYPGFNDGRGALASFDHPYAARHLLLPQPCEAVA